MKSKLQLYKRLLFIILTIGLVNCQGEAPDQLIDQIVPVQLNGINNGDTFTINDEVSFDIQVNKPEGLSKLTILLNGDVYATDLEIKNQSIVLKTDSTSKVGKYNLQLTYIDASGKSRSDSREFYFFSDIIPQQKTAEIVGTYPHAKTSYTQGLEFYQGKLFEGTGQYSQSILAEVELKTGTKLREIPLDGSTFGEGITVLNDRIYQITYKSELCYVYDMEFNLIRTMSYNGEGWGLCNDGTNLIMSNGSQEIVWRNPETFEIVKSIEVFDNQYSIGQLNELELINGNLFINLYTETHIAEVDTATGKVLTYIDCQVLVNDAKEPGVDVLNGIAYNPATQKLYMTGKWWSKLYEVSFK